jgi:hypothetical protein
MLVGGGGLPPRVPLKNKTGHRPCISKMPKLQHRCQRTSAHRPASRVAEEVEHVGLVENALDDLHHHLQRGGMEPNQKRPLGPRHAAREAGS